MNTTLRKLFVTLTLLLVLTLSAFVTAPVYADEATPEETVEVTEQTSTQDEATEETPQPDVKPESTPESSDSAEAVESIIESLPEDMQLVVLDEEGEALPLVSQEAEQAVVVGDPIWCPTTVAIPTPNLNGCSGSYATFALLFADPIFTGVGPAKDGIIWVASNYVGEANTVDIGSALVTTTLKDYKLTINGGWCDGTDITCVGLIDPSKPSVFTTPLIITGWNNDITINNISIIGSNEVAPYSLHVETTKNITLNNVEVSATTDGGAFLDNDTVDGTGNVAVNNSEFNDIAHANGGLRIDSKGTVTLKNVEANDNGTGGVGIGILIYNNNASTPKNVTVTNVTVENNQESGLLVNSKGLITITDITAIGNGAGGSGDGVTLTNLAGTAGVTLNGTNLFYDNDDYGLIINSKGAVKASNLHAINNGIHGVYIINDTAATPQPVTIIGSSTFKFNGSQGLVVLSLGQITANNITANSNTGIGVQLTNSSGPDTSGVTLTGTNQFNNNSVGLDILTKGAVTLNTLTANENTNDGVSINNTSSTTFKGVILNGVNTFEDNGGTGLDISSDGIITLNNINANQNHGFYGVFLDNTDSTPTTPKAIIIKGNNTISNNDRNGFYIYSHGAITINNLIANYNGLVDLVGYNLIDNASSTTKPAGVTFTGTSQFIGNYNNGLYILSIGVIKLNNITVNDSVASTGGAFISNAAGSATADVILTGKNVFTGNTGLNLDISSYGAITLSNITASDGGGGANLLNTGSSKPKGITLSGTNIFNDNAGGGLSIQSQGVVTVNNITANNNGTGGSGGGVTINNSTALSPMAVNILGTNYFNNNAGTGLEVNSDGNIKGNNITANGSVNALTYGAQFSTNTIGAIGSVTLTGKNTFIGNNNNNLHINSFGMVMLSNITASNSQNSHGVNILNTYAGTTAPKPVTLTGVNVFENNDRTGLNIVSYGAVTTNSITATGNGIDVLGGNGVNISNAGGSVPTPVTMNGTNVLTGNKNENLSINTDGAVKINNLNASNSLLNAGADIINDSGVSNVTLTGTNTFSGNGALYGLGIQSNGVISLSNITASNNTGRGVYIVHTGTTETVTTKPITISGYLIANDNSSYGVEIQTYNQVTLNNVTAKDNGSTGVYIDQNHASSVTPTNITIKGVNTITGNGHIGLDIDSLGTLLLNSINASGNSSTGAKLYTNNPNATGTITLTGTNIFSSNAAGVDISANGAVTINNVTSSDNTSAGVFINNTNLGTSMPKFVKFTGTNVFSDNGSVGLEILTYGVVTINSVTANDNNSNGVTINNSGASTPAHVTITGKNQFNLNTLNGLYVQSKGNITISNLTAYENGSSGANLSNNTGTSTTKVTITGVNSFTENTDSGLFINTLGTVVLSKITADGNGGSGALINIASGGSITLTCGSFVNNTLGLNFNVPGAVVTLKGVIAVGNTQDYAITFTSLTQTHGCPLP